jgi:CheY-like chemotaxis protein
MNSEKSILIVDDELAVRDILIKKIHDLGLKVFSAVDGQQALTLALEKHPDLILLDILMPNMDGKSFMTHLRQDEWGKDAPVVILTNLGPSDHDAKAIANDNPSDYLVKANYSIDDVIDKIKQYL